MLVALLLAVALTAAGYAALLALRQTPVDLGDPATLSRMPTLPDPSRLPRRALIVPASLPADRSTFPTPTRALAIEVHDLPLIWRTLAGVAVYDEAGLQWAWLPLADATQQAGALQLTATVPAAGALRLHVAADESRARRGYWLRADAATTAAAVTLRVPVQELIVRTDGMPRSLADAMQLRRVDDADWRAIDAFAETSATDDRGELHLILGPGHYELQPWTNGAWQPLSIAVPGPRVVSAAFQR